MAQRGVLKAARSSCPVPEAGEAIVRVTRMVGNRVVEAELPPPPPGASAPDAPQAGPLLCAIPSRFHKTIWAGVGSFLIIKFDGVVRPKEQFEVLHILLPEHVKRLRRDPDVWPPGFAFARSNASGSASGIGGSRARNDDTAAEDDDDSEDGLDEHGRQEHKDGGHLDDTEATTASTAAAADSDDDADLFRNTNQRTRRGDADDSSSSSSDDEEEDE